MEETKYIYADKSEYPEVCVQEKKQTVCGSNAWQCRSV